MTPNHYAFRPAARRDFDAYVDYLRENAGAATSIRFVDAARHSFARLIENPGMGPAVQTRSADLKRLRKWRIDGFPNVLVFYLIRDSAVEIVRLIHSAQDWWAMFEVD